MRGWPVSRYLAEHFTWRQAVQKRVALFARDFDIEDSLGEDIQEVTRIALTHDNLPGGQFPRPHLGGEVGTFLCIEATKQIDVHQHRFSRGPPGHRVQSVQAGALDPLTGAMQRIHHPRGDIVPARSLASEVRDPEPHHIDGRTVVEFGE